MAKFDCPDKYITMVCQCHNGIMTSVQYLGTLQSTNGLKQGCILAPILFSNLFLPCCIMHKVILPGLVAWRIPLFSNSIKVSQFSYFFHFLPHFGPPGGRESRLRHWESEQIYQTNSLSNYSPTNPALWMGNLDCLSMSCQETKQIQYKLSENDLQDQVAGQDTTQAAAICKGQTSSNPCSRQVLTRAVAMSPHTLLMKSQIIWTGHEIRHTSHRIYSLKCQNQEKQSHGYQKRVDVDVDNHNNRVTEKPRLKNETRSLWIHSQGGHILKSAAWGCCEGFHLLS